MPTQPTSLRLLPEDLETLERIREAFQFRTTSEVLRHALAYLDAALADGSYRPPGPATTTPPARRKSRKSG